MVVEGKAAPEVDRAAGVTGVAGVAAALEVVEEEAAEVVEVQGAVGGSVRCCTA